MIPAPLYRFTADQYQAMTQAGVLKEDDRVELLNGRVFDMMPIEPQHGGVVDWLAEVFTEANQRRWICRIQSVVRLSKHDEPQPDLMLLHRLQNFYRNRHPGPDEIYLLVEVSDSSLTFDREEKLPLYARAEIPEVWLVNLPDKLVEVYTKPAAGEYTALRKVLPGEPLAPEAFPDVGVDTAALLGGLE